MANLKQIALGIFHHTLAAIDISAAMHRKLQVRGNTFRCGDTAVDLGGFERVYVLALGKASQAMVAGLRELLPPELPFEGIVVAPGGTLQNVTSTASVSGGGLRYFAAGHPVPNQESWAAAQAIVDLLRSCDATTLVFFLLSGGGSALMELPLNPKQTLTDVQAVHHALVTCGAPIDAMNAVRKHLSAVKGGRLTVAAGAATKITLAVSDVPLGKESALASGPTIADPTTLADVARVMREYALEEKFPDTVKKWLAAGKMPETPKASHAAFANAHFFLMLGMDDLFHPAHKFAEAAGCVACCDNATDDWPVVKAAEYLLMQLADLGKAHPGRRVAVIADGEVSSPVTGNGLGGRNSAFVLACAQRIAGKNIAVLSCGTDGIDGNSPAAGAVADGQTVSRGLGMGMEAGDYLLRSDAFRFFSGLGDAVITGATGNNLRDLRILIAEG
jgi:glycerate 2-kinase